MHHLYKLILPALFVCISMGLSHYSQANDNEREQDQPNLNVEEETDAEFYDYNTGTYYSGLLNNLIFRKIFEPRFKDEEPMIDSSAQ